MDSLNFLPNLNANFLADLYRGPRSIPNHLAYRFSEGNAGPSWSVVRDTVTRTEGNSGFFFRSESEKGEIPDPYSYGRIGDGNLHIRMGSGGRPEFARRQPDGTFAPEEVELPKTGRFENDFRSLGNGIYMNRDYDGTVNFGVRSAKWWNQCPTTKPAKASASKFFSPEAGSSSCSCPR